MTANKTVAGHGDVAEFLDRIADPGRQADCRALAALMQEISGEAPVLWGPAMVGFGRYRYRYDSGRSGEWFIVGFSPRKADLTLYLMSGFETNSETLVKLGKYKTGKSCLYLKKLADVDLNILKSLVAAALDDMAPQRVR